MKKKCLVMLFSVIVFLMLSRLSDAIETGIKGFEFNGYLKNETAVRIEAPFDFMKVLNELDLRFTYRPIPDLKFYLQLRPMYDGVFDLRKSGMGDPDGLPFKHQRKNALIRVPRHELEEQLRTNVDDSFWLKRTFLREAWVDYTIGKKLEIKLGKQQVWWGKSDGLRLLDVINPIDYRNGPLDEFEDSKIPLWMVNLRYYFSVEKNMNLQFIYIPFYWGNVPAPPGSNWATGGDTANFNLQRNLYGWPGVYKSSLRFKDPKHEGEYGIRWEGKIGTKTDYTLNFFYTHDDDNAYPKLVKADLTPTGEWYEHWEAKPALQRIYGGSFSHAFDNFLGLIPGLVMRGELAFYHDKMYYQHRLGRYPEYGPYKSDTLRYVLGFDKVAFTDWLFSFQVFQDIILDYPKHADLLGAGAGKGEKLKSVETTLSLLISTDFYHEKIKPEFFILSNITKRSVWIRPRVVYNYNDHLDFWLGVNLFWGPPGDYFGEFRKNDQVFAGVKYSF